MQTVQFMALAGSEAQPIDKRLLESSTDRNRGEKSEFLFEEVMNEEQKSPIGTLETLIDDTPVGDQPESPDEEPVEDDDDADGIISVEGRAIDTPGQLASVNRELPEDQAALVGVIQGNSDLIDDGKSTSDKQLPLDDQIAKLENTATLSPSVSQMAKTAETPRHLQVKAINPAGEMTTGQTGEAVSATNRLRATEIPEKPNRINIVVPGNEAKTQGIELQTGGRLAGFQKSDHPVSVRDLSATGPSSSSTARLPVPSVTNASGAYGGVPIVSVQKGAIELGRDELILKADETAFDRSLVSMAETPFSLGPVGSIDGIGSRPEVGRLVATQMLEAMLGKQNKPIEIALHPEELGRVRMVLSTSDTGVAISITAERPETLDLMRRHIGQLVEEFRRLGYGDIKFDFSGGNGDQGFDQGRSGPSHAIMRNLETQEEVPDSNSIQSARESQSRGLDLRL